MDQNSNRPNLTPLTGFWCLKSGEFTDFDRQVLTDLYLPLIGTTAFSIYQLLWQMIPNKKIVTDRQSHSVLFSRLGIDIKTFLQEKDKLEALSLLKSYQKTDDLGDFIIYQLFEPIEPARFFNDDILSVFLLEQIGESEYQKLVEEYRQNNQVLKGAQDISKTFFQVFKLHNKELLNNPSVIRDTREHFVENSNPDTPKMSVQSNDLDFELIEDRVGQLFNVSQKEILKNQQLLLSIHNFYGVDEIAMIDLIGQTLDITNNTIDANSLKRLVQKRFERKSTISARVEQPDQPQESEAHFSSKDPNAVLINRAKTTAPADFLADEKRQRNGFTGNSESRALRTLASRSVLPNPVLNILVHYVLDQSPTLILPLMETIANDWKQNNVQTPEDALKRINDFTNRPRKSNGPKRNFARKPTRVEKATDWNKVKSKPTSNADAQQAEQRRLQMLRKLRNKGNQ